jgi:hypothetical protein
MEDQRKGTRIDAESTNPYAESGSPTAPERQQHNEGNAAPIDPNASGSAAEERLRNSEAEQGHAVPHRDGE